MSTVAEQIEQAFDSVTRGSGVTLHEAERIDDYASLAERAAARKLDRESHWREVPGVDIALHGTILSSLDDAGFRYYLPAYMIWTLRNYRQSQSLASDFTIYALDVPEFANLGPSAIARFMRLFDAPQRAAICAFLEEMAADNDEHVDSVVARHALETFWRAHAKAVPA